MLADLGLAAAELHTTGLTASAGMYLCFDYGLLGAELAVGLDGLVGGAAKIMPVYWYPLLFKEAFGLIFMYFHSV